MNRSTTPSGKGSGGEADPFTELISASRKIKEDYVDPRIKWYKTHTRVPRTMFRCAGILTILLSVTLPALAAAQFPYKDYVLSVVSILIAAITGLGSFYRWERTWRGNSTAQVAIEQHCAKWELELKNAELVLAHDQRMKHVYTATNDLLTGVQGVLSSETEGFFSGLQFPPSDSNAKD